MKVTLESIKAKIKSETYLVLPDGRTTLCVLTLENGFTVTGTAACVDPKEFDMNVGRKYSFEDAMRTVCTVEAYLLMEKAYWDRAQPVATNPPPVVTPSPPKVKKLHWTQTPAGKAKMAKRKSRGKAKK